MPKSDARGGPRCTAFPVGVCTDCVDKGFGMGEDLRLTVGSRRNLSPLSGQLKGCWAGDDVADDGGGELEELSYAVRVSCCRSSVFVKNS